MKLIKNDTRLDKRTLKVLIDKHTVGEISINSDSVDDEIRRIEDIASNSKNKTVIKNVNNITDYLKKVKRLAKDTVNVKFDVVEDKIVSKPFEILKVAELNMQTTDLMSINNKRVVELDYSELMNTLAFNLCYIDIGFTREEIEVKLEDVGIIGINDGSLLDELVLDLSFRELYSMKVEECDFICRTGTGLTDFFGVTVKDCKTYKESMEKSCAKIMGIICTEVLSNIDSREVDMKLAAVYDAELVFICNEDIKDTDIKNILVETVIRVFGRKFKFIPKIKTY